MITWAENGGLKENDLAQLSYTLLKDGITLTIAPPS